ncbi:PilX N-terminal domain-containing pilus assembly protein [Methylomicrobium sp. Wu6]|uniref:pilus assembly PilX family protein n=1 Tax=Methylomicrobium sp. Wu6 TaxID=3107928 RepID=UPI002DD62907|nr:PilX N-terminal domain-containing pilus assembly protein [Methylomicrobium sp. Wu6]MEC4747466.1 PilX N-terminal domain-containing pilus assembly protein [Methylomicrobium sp. Wu6]
MPPLILINVNSRQQGAAALIVVLVLAIIMAVITLSTVNTGVMEQKSAGNDLRAREAQEAAEAGLEYGVAWAKNHTIPATITCATGSLPTGCPSSLTTVSGSSTGETYNYILTYTKGTDSIRVTSSAQGVTDNTIAANSEAFVKQIPKALFDTVGATMPPPWVIAGCITSAPTGTPDTFVLNATNNAVIGGTSSDPSCLQQGHLDVTTWNDTNGNGVKDSGEDDTATTFNRGSFPGCPSTNCSWNHVFNMSLVDAKALATAAGHVYNGSIPCGPANSSPSIYIINNGGPINSGDISGSCSGTGINSTTIGAPHQPIVLIIPSASGCPKFNGGITIYGIVYMESPTDCASNGWGGATVYGSVIWEGDVAKPNANSQFIEVDWENEGNLNTVFNIGMDDATRIPGTWKDF